MQDREGTLHFRRTEQNSTCILSSQVKTGFTAESMKCAAFGLADIVLARKIRMKDVWPGPVRDLEFHYGAVDRSYLFQAQLVFVFHSQLSVSGLDQEDN